MPIPPAPTLEQFQKIALEIVDWQKARFGEPLWDIATII
tara:strand:+ start:329 stop:445 length:117 start_codon:yes stop_codon:yes gene_type:complete